MAMRSIDLKRFLREVKDRHTRQRAHPFCFVLGAGASKQSDIPMGGELVERWLKDLHNDADHKGQELSKWATAANLGIKGFIYDKRAEFYGKIYAKRFHGTSDTGHAEIQALLSGKEPSFGYSILAYILANTPHKAVITTNFDNLVADALYLYSQTAPIQCIHESLAPFANHQLDRPLIVKIHRDLLLNPRSADDEIDELHGDWKRPLTNLLGHFTPIFIGYGGNDGSLMGFLENLPSGTPDRIYWCVRGKDSLNTRVKKLLDDRQGTLVSIQGFDEIMLALKDALEIPDLLPDLEDRHRKRVERYQKQFADLNKAVLTASKAPDATTDQKVLGEAASAAVQQLSQEDTPDSWILRAQAETDKDKAEAIYRQALDKHPQNGDLMCAFGQFLANERQRFQEAEDLIRQAYEADPENPDRLTDYGRLLVYYFKDGRRAEPLLSQAVQLRTETLGPEHPSTLTSRVNLGNSLYSQGKHAEAEAEYRAVGVIQERVIGAKHPSTLDSRMGVANALYSQGKYTEAEAEHRAVLAIREHMQGAEHLATLRSRNNLANALRSQGKYSEAEAEYRAVLALQERVLGAEHPDTLSCRMGVANALSSQGKNAAAEAEYREVLALREQVLGAEHPDTLSSRNNLANALDDQGKHAEAEAEFRAMLPIQERVLGAEHPNTLYSRMNLANALQSQGKFGEAEAEHRAVIDLRERVLGTEHPDTLTSRNNLANALFSQGKYADAEAEYRAVLSIQERVLGAEHPNTLRSQYNLALALEKQDRLQEALVFMQRAEAGWTKVLGAEHLDSKDAKEGVERIQGENPGSGGGSRGEIARRRLGG